MTPIFSVFLTISNTPRSAIYNRYVSTSRERCRSSSQIGAGFLLSRLGLVEEVVCESRSQTRDLDVFETLGALGQEAGS